MRAVKRSNLQRPSIEAVDLRWKHAKSVFVESSEGEMQVSRSAEVIENTKHNDARSMNSLMNRS